LLPFVELLLNLCRLQVNVAKIQQSIPELKRDGSNVLGSLWSTTVYGDNNSSTTNSVITQMNFIPTLIRKLQTDPQKTIATFNEIRNCCEWIFLALRQVLMYLHSVTDPTGVRFSVIGDVLRIETPRSPWARYFHDVLPVC